MHDQGVCVQPFNRYDPIQMGASPAVPAFRRLCRPLVATVVVVTNDAGGSDS